MFNFAHPLDIITAVEKYCCSFYSSNLWMLDSPEVESLCSSWRTNIKLAWNVNRACHTYFISEVLAPTVRPLKSSLMSRFHNFFMLLMESPSHEVKIMARLSSRDLRSSLGSNLRLIAETSNCDPWEVSNVELKYCLREGTRVSVPGEDQWRIQYLAKLLNDRLEAFYTSNNSQKTILDALITSLVSK